MSKNNTCPICGEGNVSLREEQVLTKYKTKTGQTTMHLLECDLCGSEFAGAEESRFNKRTTLRFRKQVDDLLLGEEIKRIREHYHLTQKQAAHLFGGGPVAFSKYENDDVLHSDAMDNLLRLVDRCESAFCELARAKGMTEVLPQQDEWYGDNIISFAQHRPIQQARSEIVANQESVLSV